MKKLNALILSALIAPAMALSTAALADDRDDDMLGGEQHEGQDRDGQEGAGMERDGEEGFGEEQAGQDRAGEQQLSGKPAGAFYADDVIGNTVKHRGTDEDVGEIQDLIIGDDGRVVGVVVTTGGFLGLGGQEVGLGWDHIQHTQEDDESVFYTDMDEDTLRNAPEFERD